MLDESGIELRKAALSTQQSALSQGNVKSNTALRPRSGLRAGLRQQGNSR
jgi:hypothetical protein